ncbi:MAG: hypothetical protein KBD56_08305 [Candidatus Eisenbacteria bacterium]|nr:hypothetical protein [Candidatus Eisenbacteria bacterium]
MQTRWMTLLLLCVLLPAPATAEPETQESRSAAIRAPLPPPDSHRAPSRGVVLTDAGLLEVAPTPIAPAPLGPKQIATLEAVGDVGDGRTEYFASTGHYYDEPPDMYMCAVSD